jgi:SHOCT-like domain
MANVYTFRSFRKQKEENKMSENQKRILEMLANKKISVDEAYRLLSALKNEAGASDDSGEAGTTGKPRPKYLRVSIQPGAGHEHDDDVNRVNVRVPLSLIRSGMKFTSLLPPEARDKVTGALQDKGIDFDMRNLKPEDLDEIIEALKDLEVDVVSNKDVVKVFVEQ